MGILPIVFLKKRSAIVLEDIVLRVGIDNNSLPNLNGCEGYVVCIYLLNVNCAWSCNPATVWKSLKTLGSDELESGNAGRNKINIVYI